MKKTIINSRFFIIFILGFMSGCVSTTKVAEPPESDEVLARARSMKLLQLKDPAPSSAHCEKLGSFSILQKNRTVTPQVQAARAFGDPNFVKHARVVGTGNNKADEYDVYNCVTKKN